MTKEISLPKKYEIAERTIWFQLPLWKRDVVISCRINETEDRIFTEYARDICKLAETEGVKLDESLPAVPDVLKSAEETRKAAV